MAPLQNIKYNEVRPRGTYSGADFRGSQEFQFNIPAGNEVERNSMFLTTQVELTTKQSQTANAWYIKNFSNASNLSKAPAGCFFLNMDLYLNNTRIAHCSDIPQANLIHQTLTNSPQKLTNNMSYDPILYHKRMGIDTTLDVEKNTIGDSMIKSLGLLNVEDAQDTNNVTFTVDLSLKLPLFLTNTEIKGNSNFRLVVTIDPNYKYNLTNTDGELTHLLSGDDTLPATGTALNQFGVTIKVKDFILKYLSYETDTVPRGITDTIKYTELFTTTEQITGSPYRSHITLPYNITSFGFCFFDSRRSSNSVNSPTDISSCEAAKNLMTYEIRYGNNIMPQPRYDLNLEDAVIGSTSGNRKQNSRAFAEFINQTSALSPNGSVFDLNSWASNFVAYHNVAKMEGDLNNIIDIFLEFSTSPANSHIFFFAYYDKQVDVVYNNEGIINNVIVTENV